MATSSAITSKVSHELVQFADSLKPSDDYKDTGTATLQKIFTSLQAHPQFPVDRTLFAGSVGKRTSVLYPDFDGVVFLNNRQPPLTDSVTALKSFLTINANAFGIISGTIKSSPYSVNVFFKNGLEMDILPACNYSKDPLAQYNEVIRQIRLNPSECMSYSSSLADTQIQFLKDQSTQVHQLIRLVKYWFKTLSLGEKVYGGSYLMEVISVAAYVLRSCKSSPMLDSFKEVLRLIANVGSLRIAFLQTEANKWRVMEGNQAYNYQGRFRSDILIRSKYIIDPSNPWNDLAENISPSVASKLSNSARAMIQRLDALGSLGFNQYRTITANGDVGIHVDKIFAPILDRFQLACKPRLTYIHFDYQINYGDNLYNTRTVFRAETETRKKFAEGALINLASLVRGKVRRDNGRFLFRNGLADVPSRASVQEAITPYLSYLFSAVRESNRNEDHSQCDATLYIPYIWNDKIWAVRCSMMWSW